MVRSNGFRYTNDVPKKRIRSLFDITVGSLSPFVNPISFALFLSDVPENPYLTSALTA